MVNFNSTIVRLKVDKINELGLITNLFQFYNSSIKSNDRRNTNLYIRNISILQ